MEQIRQHPVLGADILVPLTFFESIDDVLDMLRQNMADLALQNRLEKKTARLFPTGF
jgi:hypothetical protein